MESFLDCLRLLVGCLVCGFCLGCSSSDSNVRGAQSAPEAGRVSAAGGGGDARSEAARAGRGGAAASAPRSTAGASGSAGSTATATPASSAPRVDPDDGDAGVIAPTVHKTPPGPSMMLDWDEATGGKPVNCEPGHYVGTFMCDLATADLGTAHISGPVELTLQQSKNGEFLEISDAHISGFALLFLNFQATLAGRLECTTRKLSAMAVNGAVGLGSADLLPVLGFSGQLNGELATGGELLSGTWSFPVTLPDGSQLGTCVGPWTATRMEP